MSNLRFFRKQTTPQNPCGLCIDPRNGQIVIAEFGADGGLDIYRPQISERRAINIFNTELRTTLLGGNAHTDQLHAPVDANNDDEAILKAIISLDDETHSLGFSRTPDGRVLTTQVDQRSLNDVSGQILRWFAQQQPENTRTPEPTLRIETRARAIARLWNASNQPTPEGAVAFLVLSGSDYAAGLWSENTGLVYETEEQFEGGSTANIKCEHAREMFCRLVAQNTLDDLELPPVNNVVVSAPEDLEPIILELLGSSEELNGVTIRPVMLALSSADEASPLDQATALAIGALLDDTHVAPCDLAVSPEDRLAELHYAAAARDRANNSNKVIAACVAFLVPLVAVAAFVITCALDYKVEGARLQSRINQENATTTKLSKENADYDSAKANFATFNTLLDNLITLRRRQPATYQLLRDLNQRWPQDPTWSIQEVNAKGGSIEIKGRTKSEQSITAFTKSLEFSDGLFTNVLTKNNVQGNAANTAAQPTAAQSNVIEFTVLTTYTPLAVPGSQAPGQPQAQQLQVPTAIPLNNQPGNTAPGMQMPMPNIPGRAPMSSPTPMNNQSSGATK